MTSASFYHHVYTCTYPCTISNFLVQLSVYHRTVIHRKIDFAWALIHSRQGFDPANLFIAADNSNFYTGPNQDILCWGFGSTCFSPVPDEPENPTLVNQERTSKTSRKMKVGDRISVANICSELQGAYLQGVIQFFIKS